MRIVRLAVRGFLSYDDLDLDFSDIDIAAIVGDVGSGKSSLMTAITWCLWGVDDRRGEQVIGDDFDECRVRVEFIARGDHWSVERTAHRSGRNSTLSLAKVGDEDHVGNERSTRTEHKIADTQADINRKIGLTYDAISAGPLMIQDNAGTFMDLKPGPRKELLIKMFGVEIYEVYRKVAATHASDYGRLAEKASDAMARLDEILAQESDARAVLRDAKYDLSTAQQEREHIEAELTMARERHIALREQSRHALTLSQTVEMLRQRITSDEKEHSRVLRQISDAHQSVDAPEPQFEPLIDVSDEVIATARTEFDRLRLEIDERHGLESRLPLLAQQLERMRTQAEVVKTVPCGGEGIYATCRFLTGAPKAEEIEAQDQEVQIAKRRLESLSRAVEYDAAERQYQTLQASQMTVQREQLRRDTLVAQWSLKIESARQTVANGQDTLRRLTTQIERDKGLLARAATQLSEMDTDQSDVVAAEVAVEALQTQLTEHARSIDMVYQPAVARADERVRAIEVAKQEREGIAKKYTEAKGKADVYSVLVKAFHPDGIPTMILENGIPLIEERANEVLARMPETRQVRILTQREKKATGKAAGMMERVDVVVERGGRRRGYGALSGGEKFRVAFALRIAIGHALAHRSGATIDTLILDEGWGSQDEKGVEALLESLAAVQNDFGLVLIITHLKAVSDRIQKQIQVVRPEDGYSSATIAA